MDDPAYLAARADDLDDLFDPELDEDPDSPPWLDAAELAALAAEAREITAEQARAEETAARLGHTAALAATGASLGRRGSGMPGSGHRFPGEFASSAAGFASGRPLDTAPGCAALASFLEDAATADDAYQDASDDELLGVICAWDRAESAMAARKHAAVAALIRRRPAPGCELEGEAAMPEAWHEFTGRELSPALGISAGEAEEMLGVARELEVSLPGTRAAFRSGVVNLTKARIIAAATTILDPAEARAAEALVLDRAGSLTPGALRAAIQRAVFLVAPEKARKRREHAAKQARVERWAEPSGNAGLAGRELPPAEVLAADQRVTWWARQLRKAGLEGSMDHLRARAFLDILLGLDSRPQPATDSSERGRNDSPPDRPQVPAPAGPLEGVIPPGFAGRVNLTISLATLLGLADRPGELGGIGPVDPDLARDLARAAALSTRSTWCVTVTDGLGHAIGHGCARPAPAAALGHRSRRDRPTARDGPPPPDPRPFRFSRAEQAGPPGGYGSWRVSTGVPGQRDMILQVESLATTDCDHRHEAKGHDPGVLLRHLTEVRHATCTGLGCRRPSGRCDFEHSVPHEAGGRTCLCNGDPKCRFDHRLKQDPRWRAEQLGNGEVRWTTPSGRQYTTEPTRYPI